MYVQRYPVEKGEFWYFWVDNQNRPFPVYSRREASPILANTAQSSSESLDFVG